jgi:hypothetical protein
LRGLGVGWWFWVSERVSVAELPTIPFAPAPHLASHLQLAAEVRADGYHFKIIHESWVIDLPRGRGGHRFETATKLTAIVVAPAPRVLVRID